MFCRKGHATNSIQIAKSASFSSNDKGDHGDGNNCNCSNLSSCPKCDPTKGADAWAPPAWLAPPRGDCVDVEGACDVFDGKSTCCPGLVCYENTACIKLDT